MTPKILTLGFAFVLFLLNTFAQDPVPGIRWQRTIGGLANESNFTDDSIYSNPKLLIKASDGGFYVGATSSSNDGDFTGHRGFGDAWVAKLDANRNIIWRRSFGGSGFDYLASIHAGIGGGVVLIGTTKSTDGDMAGNHGTEDIFVCKYDNSGNLEWKKLIGGFSADRSRSIYKVGNTGYVITGASYSNNGNIEPSISAKGNGDLYLAMINPEGEFIWQKKYGGSSYDGGAIAKPTSDGGFIVGGSTRSGDGDVNEQNGGDDIWILKLDKDANIQWNRVIGGRRFDAPGDVEETKDGGFIIAGVSNSDSGQLVTDGSTNGCLVKLGASGNLEWAKTYGGPNQDEFHKVIVEPDNSYSIIGSNASINNGGDIWFARVNADGGLRWQKTFGSLSWDEGNTIIKIDHNQYVGMGVVSGNGGDVTGHGGSWDVWIFGLGAVNYVAGKIFYDTNLNGVYDNGELLTDEARITATESSYTKSTIPTNGIYSLDVDTGSYSITAVPAKPYYTVLPASVSKTYSTFFNIDSVHFALQPIPGKQDLTINLVPITAILRPGFDAQNLLLYKNEGTTTVTAPVIKFKPDPKMILKSTIPTVSQVVNDTLIWNLSSLAPNASGQIELNFRVSPPPTVNLGDTLRTLAFIDPIANDITPFDDTARLVQGVRGSYDPNDKTEANGGAITPAHVESGKPLSYLIRFQNTGTDTAFTVVVRDTLGAQVDWASLEMVQTSHPGQLEVKNGNQLTWTFNDIKLVDSNTNEPLSHGYIAYRIKPVSTLVIGDTVKNSASIYFDYNLPVLTNTEKTVVSVFVALPINLTDFKAVKNGKAANLTWKTASESNALHFEIERSANGSDFSAIGTVRASNASRGGSYQFTDQQPLPGYNYYRLKLVDLDGTYKNSKIALLNFAEASVLVSGIYPNPTANRLVLELNPSVQQQMTISVYDQLGRIYFQKKLVLTPGLSKTVLDLGALTAGSYLINLKTEATNETHQVIIKR